MALVDRLVDGDSVIDNTCSKEPVPNGYQCKAKCKGNAPAQGNITCASGALGGYSFCSSAENITGTEYISVVQGQLSFVADKTPTDYQIYLAMCAGFNFYTCEYVLSAFVYVPSNAGAADDDAARRLALSSVERESSETVFRRLQLAHLVDYSVKVPSWSTISTVANKAREFSDPNSAAVSAFIGELLSHGITVTEVTATGEPSVLLNVVHLLLKRAKTTTTTTVYVDNSVEEESLWEKWWWWVLVVLTIFFILVAIWCILKKYNEHQMMKGDEENAQDTKFHIRWPEEPPGDDDTQATAQMDFFGEEGEDMAGQYSAPELTDQDIDDAQNEGRLTPDDECAIAMPVNTPEPGHEDEAIDDGDHADLQAILGDIERMSEDPLANLRDIPLAIVDKERNYDEV